MQVMPSTAPGVNPYDVQQNIAIGIAVNPAVMSDKRPPALPCRLGEQHA
jgi:hypothetical protein